MPYYRIVIWTKRRRQPYVGIRHISQENINAVYNMIQSKANSSYRQDLVDIEVQMLSKLCKAVQEYLKKPELPKSLMKS
jgi:vacuolar-type H+-ATPase subunit E/Vma4